MATSITDRLTAAIRIADQSVEHAQFQSDYRNWLEIRTTLLAARDELNKPQIPSDADIQAIAPMLQKIDGRTKEARAAKAANG
jgi:hypothetical protein